MPTGTFGPFASAFERGELEVPGYLHLLHLGDRSGVGIVIERIAGALSQGDSRRWVRTMMLERNWRPHLVGAVAFLLDEELALDRGDLWAAIDGGSWVIPQLAATALFADSTFPERVRTRLDAHCPVSQFPSQEFETGDQPRSGSRATRGKIAASLLSLASRVPALSGSEASWRADPKIQELLALDAAADGSAKITAYWADEICACFRDLELELAPVVA